ncbi:MAG: biotin/lipoyl-binding protein [Gammaproteobacteria bacterium]|nr:biotin/lipoyl-binding protein [Gammaproteobacteria bacterium]
MHHAFKLGEVEHELWLSHSRGDYQLHLGDSLIPVALRRDDHGRCFITTGETTTPVTFAVRGDEVHLHIDGAAYTLRYRHPMDRLAAQAHHGADDAIRAPMPGSTVAVRVKPGQSVARGEALLVMESMKMETTITAPRDGVVESVHVVQGQTFERDTTLVSLVAEGAT